MAIPGDTLLRALLLFWVLIPFLNVAGNELCIVTHPSALRLASGKLVETSPDFKQGSPLVCERIHIHGYSRYKNLGKYANILKVKVEAQQDQKFNSQKVEICFHRNASLGLGMCSQGKWDKLAKGSWSRSMSPFQDKFLDLRMPGTTLEFLVVSTEEGFLMYRIVFLVVGLIMMTLAPAMSNSIVFYYSSAMTVGVILVVLMVLFQGMKLLPTGRRNSLAIFMYSSLVGVGSFVVRYLSGLLRSFLIEIGIGEDIYNPVAVFFLVCLLLAGAWLGYWGVRKLVLCEDGSVDLNIAYFVKWSIWIVSSVMILQSSLDLLLATQALFCCMIISSLARRSLRVAFLYRLYRSLYKTVKGMWGRCQFQYPFSDGSPSDYEYIQGIQRPKSTARKQRRPFSSRTHDSHVTGKYACEVEEPSAALTEADTYYSTFHDTPERTKFSPEEWEAFTKESTKKALEELVSSPDFTQWAVSNAERITLAPNKDDNTTGKQPRRWFHWF